jgi:8-oxo-dGTP diphosphatase
VRLAADVAVLTIRGDALSVLLVRRADEPFRGSWALPGGLVGDDESAEDAARRELLEDTGLDALPAGAHLEQVATYSEPDRDPRERVVSVAYVAFAPGLPAPVAGGDAETARWWPVGELAGQSLAFDHDRILADAIERVRAKIEYSTLAAAFLDEPFSLGQLHGVYAAVWGEGPHLPTFRRKVMSTPGFVERLDAGDRSGDGGGPALFRRGAARWLNPPMLRPPWDDPGPDDEQA